MRDIRNVLSEDTFGSIKPGMTEQDVLRMIGPPGQTTPFPTSNTHAWDYRFMDTFGYYSIFSVTFNADAVVVSKFITRLEGRERVR
jgi:outer membrane protein assembly factor BamE (lipoprotein component of BamABCDE complex)